MIPNKQVIIRLSRYRSILYRLKEMGFIRVVSGKLAEAADVTALQVRKDFSLFEITGNKRGGYQVNALIQKLDKILGKDEIYNVILVGAGKIGKALIEYKGFIKDGINICAAFDIDPEKYNIDSPLPILPMDNLKDFVRKHNIRLAIIAVTEISAQQVLDILSSAGIKGILNFAPIRLKKSSHIVINNVNLALEFDKLIYCVNYLDKEKINI